MGLCSTKHFFNNKNLKSKKIKLHEKCLINKSTATDTEMLIPQKVINNSYLTCYSSVNDIKCQFRVSLLNENMKSICKGQLIVLRDDLIFCENDKATLLMSWAITTIRWYAYKCNLFIFQCGRQALTGEGTFIFSCDEFQLLKESFDEIMLENSLDKRNKHCRFGHKENCGIDEYVLKRNSRFDSNILKNSNAFNSQIMFHRSQSISTNNTCLSINQLAHLPNLAALPGWRYTEIISDHDFLMSNDQNLGSDTIDLSTVSTMTDEDYLTNPIAGQYLVAMAPDPSHGYINQNDSDVAPYDTYQSRDSRNASRNYLCLNDPILYAQISATDDIYHYLP